VRAMFLSAAACLFAATAAPAQTPAPVAPPQGVPTVAGPVQTGGTCLTGGCLFGKCEPCKPCTPVFAPAKKTVYATVTREYCQPCCSFCDLLWKKCGLADDCEAAPTGETRTKTLLVKKLVPKCDEGCCTPHK
jgi:hypothetical protein